VIRPTLADLDGLRANLDPKRWGYDAATGAIFAVDGVVAEVGLPVDGERIVALHNAAPALLDAAERSVLLDEVRALTNDPAVYMMPLWADLACTVRKWAVVSGACNGIGTGATELDALRDALKGLR
jgi:hypothetical protein